MKLPISLLSISVSLFSLTLQSEAEVIPIYFKGVVTVANPFVPDGLPDGVGVGSVVYGQLNVNTDGYIGNSATAQVSIEGNTWGLIDLDFDYYAPLNTIGFGSDFEDGGWNQFPKSGNYAASGISFQGNTTPAAPWTLGSMADFDPENYNHGSGSFLTDRTVFGITTDGYRLNYDITQVSLQPIPVPEPAVMSMGFVGAGLLLGRRRRELADPV